MNNTETPTTTNEEVKHQFVMDPNRAIDMRCLNCDLTAYNLDVHLIPKYDEEER